MTDLRTTSENTTADHPGVPRNDPLFSAHLTHFVLAKEASVQRACELLEVSRSGYSTAQACVCILQAVGAWNHGQFWKM